jgi:exosortase C (VPDSG-CTERM-specific)
VLVMLVFIQPLIALTALSLKSDVLSYILLVPFISGYLIYIRKDRLPHPYASSMGPTIVAVIGGSVALLGAWQVRGGSASFLQGDSLALVTLAFLSFLLAGGFAFLGKKWIGAVAFPVAFLSLMIPLPAGVIDSLETASKLASAEAAGLFFNLTGTPHFREGNFFQLPGMIIEVAQECSGIRSSLVLIITSLVAANMFLKSSWRRILLVAIVIPLGILRNGFRILIIGMLCVYEGPHMIDSAIHHRGGPIFFALSLIPLFLLLWWLRRGETQKWNVPPNASGNPVAVG